MNKSQPEISIIVPVYNVERYIEKCIKSILSQTFKNFEALIIDDGSPDRSIELARKVIGDDKRFIFFKKENGGQATARNFGLDYATSEYVCFIDSDDYIEDNYLEELHSNAVSSSADIVVCGMRLVDSNGINIRNCKRLNAGEYTGQEIFPLAIESMYFNPGPCDKIYKKKLFDEIHYPVGIYYEDLAIMYKLVFFSGKIKVIDSILYNYVKRPNSTMSSFSCLNIKSRLEVFNDMENFLKNKRVYDKYQINFTRAYLTHCVFRTIYELIIHNSNYLSFERSLRGFMSEIDLKIFSFKAIIEYFPISFFRGGLLLSVKMVPYITFKVCKIFL